MNIGSMCLTNSIHLFKRILRLSEEKLFDSVLISGICELKMVSVPQG